MRPHFPLLSSLLLALVLGLVACPALAAGPVVMVDEPGPPYTFGKLGREAQRGISLEVSREVFRRLGLSMRLDLLPWKRALKAVEQGRADGLPLLMTSPERREYMVFTRPVLMSRELFFYCIDHHAGLTWQAWSDLKGLKIGLIDGYTYGQEFLAAVERLGLAVERASSRGSNLRKLMAGRIDLYLGDETMVRYALKEHPAWRDKVVAANKPVSSYGYHMGISRRSPLAARLGEIDQAIAAMRGDGTLQRILESYR